MAASAGVLLLMLPLILLLTSTDSQPGDPALDRESTETLIVPCNGDGAEADSSVMAIDTSVCRAGQTILISECAPRWIIEHATLLCEPSSDGRGVVVRLNDGSVELRAVESGDLVHTLRGGDESLEPDAARVMSAACSRDHSLVALATVDAHIHVLREDGTPLYTDISHASPASPNPTESVQVSLCFAGPWLISGGSDRLLRSRDSVTGAAASLSQTTSIPTVIVRSPDHRRVAIGYQNGLIEIRLLPTLELLAASTPTLSSVKQLSFGRGRGIFSCSLDGALRVYDVDALQELRLLLHPDFPVERAWPLNDHELLLLSRDRRILIW